MMETGPLHRRQLIQCILDPEGRNAREPPVLLLVPGILPVAGGMGRWNKAAKMTAGRVYRQACGETLNEKTPLIPSEAHQFGVRPEKDEDVEFLCCVFRGLEPGGMNGKS